MKKNILIVTHDFPPTWHGGVVRIFSLVKQMMNLNEWNIKILSADDQYNLNVFNKIEQIKDTENKFKLIKTKSLEPKSKRFLEKVVGTRSKKPIDEISFFILKKIFEPLLIPDRCILWAPYALMNGTRVMRREEIDVVFSTAPPFTNHVIAKILSLLFNKNLVVDFRDDWVGNPFHNKGFLRKIFNKLLERWVISRNTPIITTSFESNNEFIDKYGNSIQDRINIITNGFDDKLYKKILSAKKSISCINNDKVVFLYAGSLTPKRTPEFFLKAIRSLIDKRDIRANSIQINFVGYTPIRHKNLSLNLNLNGIVKYFDAVNQDQLAEYYASSNILLLFQRKSEGGATAIPGKFYEYLCTEKPILLMSDGGATDNILKKLNAGYIAKYDSIENIANAAKMLISHITEGKALNAFKDNYLECYRRSLLNNKIIEIISRQL
jgi:glycosyltransferase involved in cell wall biosynthesis